MITLTPAAKKAIERKTGARSLKGIIEDTMLDIMFDIPKSEEPRKVTITAACINDGAQPTIEPLADSPQDQPAKPSAAE